MISTSHVKISMFDGLVKSVIEKIVFCAGEPYSVSEDVINLLYEHIREFALTLMTDLEPRTIRLRDLLLRLKDRPIHLFRIAHYFSFFSGNYMPKAPEPWCEQFLSTTDALDFESDQVPSTHNFINSNLNGWVRFTSLCTEIGIVLPQLNDLGSSEVHSIPAQLIMGRRLRLVRIDAKTCRGTTEEYLAFAQLRQSASFFALTKPNTITAFWKWAFALIPTASVETRVTSLDFRDKYLRELINVFAYLLTGEILNVIDMTLFYRQRFKIDLTSPITVIEISEAIKKLKQLSLKS